MTWQLAPCLVQLRKQLDLAYPHRSRISDGTIGDASHASRKSDHNPDPAGYVCAFDITANLGDTPDPHLNGTQLAEALTRDSRSAYVIWYGKIWTPDKGWHAYTGPSAHREHVHLSCFHDTVRRSDTRPWVLTKEENMPAVKVWQAPPGAELSMTLGKDKDSLPAVKFTIVDGETAAAILAVPGVIRENQPPDVYAKVKTAGTIRK